MAENADELAFADAERDAIEDRDAPIGGGEIEDLLRQLKRKRRLAVVLVEQNLDFIKTLSERVLIIQKGRILREVATDALGERALIGEFVGIDATEGTRMP